jgi:hypothetical protein
MVHEGDLDRVIVTQEPIPALQLSSAPSPPLHSEAPPSLTQPPPVSSLRKLQRLQLLLLELKSRLHLDHKLKLPAQTLHMHIFFKFMILVDKAVSAGQSTAHFPERVVGKYRTT